MSSQVHFTSALEDFNRARHQASIHAIISRLMGKSDDLLAYDEVRNKLRGIEGADKQLKEIPLDSIIGSVNRYTDFTRNFLPRRSIDKQRWARVKAAMESQTGLPPVEVYQIGEVYFVQDGNHRVSIARSEGSEFIEAYVKPVYIKVPFSSESNPDDLIIKYEWADFLDKTHIDQLFPNSKINITSPGRYAFILQQIEAIHFALEFKLGKEISYQDAVLYWHNNIYLPIVEIIDERGMLEDFPERTETDLYIWILKYQSELADNLGWDVSTQATASVLSSDFGQTADNLKTKLQKAFQNWLY